MLSADAINFEDYGGNEQLNQSIPYKGLYWQSFAIRDGPSYPCQSGFSVGSVTGPKVLYISGGYPGLITSSSGTKFTVAGFWATAGFKEGQRLTVISFNSTDGPAGGAANMVGSLTFTLSTTTRTFIDLRNNFRFAGIGAMQLVGNTNGIGVPCGGSSLGMEVVIDNLMLTFDGETWQF